MKKIIILAAVISVLISGCAYKHAVKKEFTANYAYDRLFSAAMLALNDSSFGLTAADRQNGTITAQDVSTVYYDWNAGVFIVLPWISTVDRHPLITMVFFKDGDKTVISAAGVFSSANKNVLPSIMEKTLSFYESPGSPFVDAVVEVKRNTDDSKKDIISPDSAEVVTLKAEVNWDNNRGVTVHNKDLQAYNDLTISVVYSSLLETKTFAFTAGTLKAGEKVNVSNSSFKDEANGGIKRNDRPGKIVLRCKIEGGKAGLFESR